MERSKNFDGALKDRNLHFQHSVSLASASSLLLCVKLWFFLFELRANKKGGFSAALCREFADEGWLESDLGGKLRNSGVGCRSSEGPVG
jgi:hypothetical protein